MLPARARLRRRDDFVATLRAGRRRAGGRGPLLVVHVDLTDRPDAAGRPPQAGFVVSRSVGGAVVRNQVRRRLRHLVAGELDRLPEGSRLVVRALPGAARASSAELAGALREALTATGRVGLR